MIKLLGRGRNPSVLLWVIRMIRRLYRGDREQYGAFLRRQAEKSDWLPRFIAAHELHLLVERDPDAWLPLLESLSVLDQEMVRQGAAHSWSELLAEDFERYFPRLQRMKKSESFPPRHTAALAPVRCFRSDRLSESAKQRVLEFWRSYEGDPRKGLWNLVRQQILDRLGNTPESTRHRQTGQ